MLSFDVNFCQNFDFIQWILTSLKLNSDESVVELRLKVKTFAAFALSWDSERLWRAEVKTGCYERGSGVEGGLVAGWGWVEVLGGRSKSPEQDSQIRGGRTQQGQHKFGRVALGREDESEPLV